MSLQPFLQNDAVRSQPQSPFVQIPLLQSVAWVHDLVPPEQWLSHVAPKYFSAGSHSSPGSSTPFPQSGSVTSMPIRARASPLPMTVSPIANE